MECQQAFVNTLLRCDETTHKTKRNVDTTAGASDVAVWKKGRNGPGPSFIQPGRLTTTFMASQPTPP